MTEENVQVSAATDNTENVETVEQPVNEAEVVQEQKEPQTAKKQDEEFVPFPKKAQNALSRRDRTIGKLQARTRELEAQLSELSKSRDSSSKSEDKGPQEKDFETYGEYLEAKTLWKVEQVQAEKQRATKEAEGKTQVSAEQQRFIAQRSQEIAMKTAEMIKTVPELKDMVLEHKDFMDSLPESVQQAFFEADDPVLAFYNMAKDGSLYELADMSPFRAAMAIAKSQNPVQQSRQTTQAPKPLQGVTGAGAGAGGLSNLDKDQDALKQWMKKKGLR